MDDLILIRQRDTLFEIILNRPDKRNAINLEMLLSLIHISEPTRPY